MEGSVLRTIGTAAFMALALGLGEARAGWAQSEWLRGPDAGFLALGVSDLSTSELDDELAERGYPTFGRTALAPSAGVYWSLPGGVLVGGEWHGLILGEEPHEGREVGLGGGYATLGIGYPMRLAPRARIYPRLGVGVGGMGLWTEREGGAVAFDEALEAGGDQAESDDHTVLSREGVVVDLGAGLELVPGGRGSGLMVGLRAGYLAGPFPTGWRLDERPVSGAPSASLAGAYLRVMVGATRRW